MTRDVGSSIPNLLRSDRMSPSLRFSSVSQGIWRFGRIVIGSGDFDFFATFSDGNEDYSAS